MTGGSRDELVQASIDRCRNMLKTARRLLDSGDFDSAASRAYYAAFHARTGAPAACSGCASRI